MFIWSVYVLRVCDLLGKVEDKFWKSSSSQELANLVWEMIAVEFEQVPRARPDYSSV